VLVKEKRVIATGYNGAPSGAPHCDVTGCIRHQEGIPSGQRLDICRASHAEANAISQCARYGVPTEGATAYVTVSPCVTCAKLLVQAGIDCVVYRGIYPDDASADVLTQGNVLIIDWAPGSGDIVLSGGGKK
jgi:dCMP deaminase